MTTVTIVFLSIILALDVLAVLAWRWDLADGDNVRVGEDS